MPYNPYDDVTISVTLLQSPFSIILTGIVISSAHTRAIRGANIHACLFAELIALVCAKLFLSKVPREAVSKISTVFNMFRLARRKSHRVR